jgi:hypothetical protein
MGEKRESLIILEKVGLYEGLLKSLGTEAMVSSLVDLKSFQTGIIGDKRDIKRR